MGGLVVLFLAGLTWIEVLRLRLAERVRLIWPSCLILLGLYNLFFSDLVQWPLTFDRFTRLLSNPQVLQHKVLAVLVLGLGLVELSRRLGHLTHAVWNVLFAAIALLAGGLLFLHDSITGGHHLSHRLLVNHAMMGLLAVLTLMLKVLADQRILVGRFAYLYPLGLMGLGSQLLLYPE